MEAKRKRKRMNIRERRGSLRAEKTDTSFVRNYVYVYVYHRNVKYCS